MDQLRLETVIAAPRPRVWAAWTTTKGLSRWWWNHWPDVQIDVDARVGGAYRFAAPTAAIVVTGIYLRVDEPTHLSFTWQWSDQDGVQPDETVDVEFAEMDGDTRLMLVHSGPWTDDKPAESYRSGWDFVLDALRRAE
jgi:uncharacterized protein YndB with AHSA1/START domain